jgi:hypothetical protein
MLISIQKENIFQVVIKAINYNIQLIEMGLEYILPLIVSCDFIIKIKSYYIIEKLK